METSIFPRADEIRNEADPGGWLSDERRWGLVFRLVASLIEAGELKPTARELAKWADCNKGLTGDVLLAMSEVVLRGSRRNGARSRR